MAYDIRWLREDEHDEVLDMLAEVMDANRGYFSDSFRREGNSAPSLVCLVDGEIASHIRIFDTRRRVGSCLVRAANIGDVCTHPRHRRRGYMTALLNVAAELLHLDGYDIAVVYSGVPIYEKAGWVRFPEPDDALLWRLLNMRSLFARLAPEFEARAAALEQRYEGIVGIRCEGQEGFLEFREGWCRPLRWCGAADLMLDVDQLTFFRMLMGRDGPSDMEVGTRLKLSSREAEVVDALFPKARPAF